MDKVTTPENDLKKDIRIIQSYQRKAKNYEELKALKILINIVADELERL